MSPIGKCSLLLSTLSATSATGTAVASVFLGDPDLGTVHVRLASAGALLPRFQGRIARPDVHALQATFDAHAKASYALQWKRYASIVTFPGKSNVLVASPIDEVCHLLNMNLSRCMYYDWMRQFSVRDPTRFAESNVRLGCLVCGVDPGELERGTLPPRTTLYVACYAAIAFPRAMSFVLDFRGSPHVAPLGSDRLAEMGGACVEFSGLVASIIRTIRECSSSLCRPVAAVLSKYRVGHLVVSARSGELTIDVKRDAFQRHVVSVLVPSSLFDDMTLPVSERVDDAPGVQMILLETLSSHALCEDLPYPGRAYEREAELVNSGYLGLEISPSLLYGDKTRFTGHAMQMFVVDDGSYIREYALLTRRDGTWSVGVDTRSLFLDGARASTHRLFKTLELRTSSDEVQKLRVLMNEFSNLKVFDGGPSPEDISDALVCKMLASSGATARRPFVDRPYSLSKQLSGMGWRVVCYVYSEPSDLSVMRTALANACARSDPKRPVSATVLGTLSLYADCNCAAVLLLY